MLSCCVAPDVSTTGEMLSEEEFLRKEAMLLEEEIRAAGMEHLLGEHRVDMGEALKTDPAFRPLTEAELDALVEAEIARTGGLEEPDWGSMTWMDEGMEPFPNQQPIPPVPAVPEDAPVVKAVLVGPTYKTSKHSMPLLGRLEVLLGSVGALEDILVALQHAKVRTPELKILTDAKKTGGWPVAHEAPTRKNILSSMQWLVQDAKPGDSLLFFFAGHAGQSRDTDGDEQDGQDEHICPVIQAQHPKFASAFDGSLEKEEADDLVGRGISDDEIFGVMLKDLPEGVRLTTIFDACHSQTLADLAHSYEVQVEGDEMARAKRQEPPPPGFSFDKRPLTHKDVKGKECAASVLCLAGCKDRETQQTWCDQSGRGMRGAFFLTNMLAKAIAGMRTPNPSYADVLREITRDFYRGNRLNMSIPSFSTSSAVDLDAKPFSFVGPL
ncbi:casB [Symbiodinium natans]|uniref:CasB protein n=1 Tax=Symbiodinium natans TaxID=878477 RepID=A0A812I0W9_9DINO|nr:casB [Symbiodinium natans]